MYRPSSECLRLKLYFENTRVLDARVKRRREESKHDDDATVHGQERQTANCIPRSMFSAHYELVGDSITLPSLLLQTIPAYQDVVLLVIALLFKA
jgi:hypothetical protein